MTDKYIETILEDMQELPRKAKKIVKSKLDSLKILEAKVAYHEGILSVETKLNNHEQRLDSQELLELAKRGVRKLKKDIEQVFTDFDEKDDSEN